MKSFHFRQKFPTQRRVCIPIYFHDGFIHQLAITQIDQPNKIIFFAPQPFA